MPPHAPAVRNWGVGMCPCQLYGAGAYGYGLTPVNDANGSQVGVLWRLLIMILS